MIKVIIFDIFGVFFEPKFLIGGDYNKEMICLAETLKVKGYRVIALSNSFGTFRPLKKVFDCIYFASQIGLYKPDTKIFEFILEKEQISAGECVFIDDSKENIEGAKKLGIESFLFENPAHVKEKLKRFF